jgi:hypothetical protein
MLGNMRLPFLLRRQVPPSKHSCRETHRHNAVEPDPHRNYTILFLKIEECCAEESLASGRLVRLLHVVSQVRVGTHSSSSSW